jgi:hypothetical protein
MGLILPALARPALTNELREIIRESGGASRAISLLPDFAERVLDRLAKRIGADVSDTYLSWVLYTYEESPSDHPHTFAWSTVLNWCAALPSRWDLLELPKTLARDMRLRVAEAMDWTEVERLVERSVEAGMSAWDARVVNDRRFDDGPWDVSLAIGSNVYRQRFRTALEWMSGQLSDEERASFRAEASAVGRENELTSIEELRSPTDLREPAFE